MVQDPYENQLSTVGQRKAENLIQTLVRIKAEEMFADTD